MMGLPRGIGLVRVETPLGVVVRVSDRLTRQEEEIARIVATALALTGRHIVILSVTEIARVMAAA